MVFYVLSYFLGKGAAEFHLTFLCDIGLPCSTSNNLKSILDRNIMFVALKR